MVVAEQCLRSIKAFSVSQPAAPASRLGVHKKLGGATAGTADPNCPKGYSILYNVMLRNKTEGVKLAGAAIARGLAEHPWAGGEQLFSFASLVCLGFYFSLFVIFLFIKIYYYYYYYFFFF